MPFVAWIIIWLANNLTGLCDILTTCHNSYAHPHCTASMKYIQYCVLTVHVCCIYLDFNHLKLMLMHVWIMIIRTAQNTILNMKLYLLCLGVGGATRHTVIVVSVILSFIHYASVGGAGHEAYHYAEAEGGANEVYVRNS